MTLKHIFYFLIFSFLTLGYTACEEDEDDGPDEFPAIDRGPTEADKLVIIFTQNTTLPNPHIDSAVVVDFDGPGGNDPVVQDSLELLWFDLFNNYAIYNAQIKFFKDGNQVDDIIQDNADRFIVCYRRFQTLELDLTRRDQDADGFPLGVRTDWITDGGPSETNGINDMRITLNYQPTRKEGLCDPGIRIMDINLPYRLTI